jgi:hypothetical protein
MLRDVKRKIQLLAKGHRLIFIKNSKTEILTDHSKLSAQISPGTPYRSKPDYFLLK